jgi:DNA-binding response OmpR family regulator
MKRRLLIVEDDAAIADFLVRGLKEEGYSVHPAVDGDEAECCLSAESWDLILLDCWLPRVDGISVLRRYRQSGGSAPVLLLTARDAVADRVHGLDSGADDYLCKPFAFAELLARIRSLLRRNHARVTPLLTYSDLAFDLTAQRVSRGGACLDLTTKEKSLLAMFMRSPNRVLSRECIYESVWQEAYDRESNTLEVHIMELRRKLEANGPRLIFTVRGRGYLLRDNSDVELEHV